jgi:DNA-directed RNA polymerase subunit K/omega
MSFQLQSQSAHLPPDYKKQLDEAVRRARAELDAAFALIDGQPDNPVVVALRRVEAEVANVENGAHHIHANADEMKAAIGRVRTQRDEAIKARNQALAYLRQRKQKP